MIDKIRKRIQLLLKELINKKSVR